MASHEEFDIICLMTSKTLFEITKKKKDTLKDSGAFEELERKRNEVEEIDLSLGKKELEDIDYQATMDTLLSISKYTHQL